MVPPDSDGVPPAPPYSGTPQRPSSPFAYGTVTLYGPPFQGRSAGAASAPFARPYNPGGATTPPVWAPPLSLAATRGITVVLFSSPYLDVSVRGVRAPRGAARLQRARLPHSETRGSKPTCGSPRLIAARRVLHRAREPRHPPCALLSLCRAARASARAARHARLMSSRVSFQHVKEPRPRLYGDGVENEGFEPSTPGLQSRRSAN